MQGKTRRLQARAVLLIVTLFQASALFAQDGGYFGFLRTRDLTPFGFLRLDMRPTHAVSNGEGETWAVEAELGYQNTWALSREVEDYLRALPGRRVLTAEDVEAIRNLPGENYLVDMEVAQLDLLLHRKFAGRWSAYLILSGVSYHGGFLDGVIEEFHDATGFVSFGRPGVRRNDFNVIFDLNSTQRANLNVEPDSGLLDPTFGVRYSGVAVPANWNLIIEAAVKVPIDGERAYLSTGNIDVGMQVSLQRFAEKQAFYASLAGVYYDGEGDILPARAQVVPTLLLGYERKLTGATHAIVQAYASRSLYSVEETGLDELRDNKYQLTLGLYHRIGHGLFSIAMTENLSNPNNAPDVGLQLGWAYSPAL